MPRGKRLTAAKSTDTCLPPIQISKSDRFITISTVGYGTGTMMYKVYEDIKLETSLTLLVFFNLSYYSLKSARSGGQPTPTGKAGRVRPRKNEEAHRTPRGKRLAAAKSTDSCLSHAIQNLYNATPLNDFIG
jgi:hypothetical protein